MLAHQRGASTPAEARKIRPQDVGLAQACAQSHDRIHWVTIPPLRCIEESVKELKWAKQNGAVGVFGGPGLIDRERMSWTALPASVRADPPAGPAWGPLPVFEGPPELADMVLRFDRRNDGWVITEVAMRPVPAAGEAFLVPD